jgi:hypothetical protein
MKKVLSALLAFVFFEVQALAMHGPEQNQSGAIALTGTYAGVLLPKSESNPQAGSSPGSSIGLFSVGVDSTGIAMGTAIIFIDGVAYNGNITAVADPDFDTLQGIIEGVSNFTIETPVETGIDAAGNPVITVVQTNIFAQGNINATISQAGEATSVNGVEVSTGVRISGTSVFQLFAELDPTTGIPIVDDTVTFTVDGFLQTGTTSTATALSLTTTGNNNNNTNTNTGTGT